jgi:hypothetical protein
MGYIINWDHLLKFTIFIILLFMVMWPDEKDKK